MSRAARPARGKSPPRKPAAPAPPVPVGRGLLAAVAVVAAAMIALAVSGRIEDPDIWQHLAVGRALWTLHAIPRTDVWTWPGAGQPYVLASWLFRALLWPFWLAGHGAGLATWRWVTTLGAFALLWRAARRGGANGLLPLLVFVWAALLYRQRSQVRPETLTAVLLACELWLLESRRHGARVHVAWLVPLAWGWVNAHVSYYFFFVAGGAYLLDELWRARTADRGARPGPLALALAAAAVACVANPFGLEALRQPVDFFLHGRHEPIYRGILELQPIAWQFDRRNGLVLFLVLSPLLALVRAMRRGPDVAELVLLAAALAQLVTAQRFIGTFALVAAPFLARDLADALAAVPRPAALAAPGARAALVGAACIVIALPELTRPEWPLGIGFDPAAYPVAACDWIAAHGVRGRAFNAYSDGGYLLWRFWPERARLPFIDVHQTGTRRDRDLYAAAWSDSLAWRALVAERDFDWAMIRRPQTANANLADFLDADTSWALVFADDAVALFLRRRGALDSLARASEYRRVPAGNRALGPLAFGLAADSTARAAVRAELERQIAESPRTGQARSVLASLEGMDGHWARTLALLREAEALRPGLARLHEREQVALAHLGAAAPRAEAQP